MIGIVYQIHKRDTMDNNIKLLERSNSMWRKACSIILASGLLLGVLTGCSESEPMDELVKNESNGLNMQNEIQSDVQADQQEIEYENIPAGSPYVRNSYERTEDDKKEENLLPPERTFPTLSKLREKVKEELGDHYWPDISISQEDLEKRTGITEDMYIEFLAEEQLMEANVDMMIIIHAKEDYVGSIEQALENYRDQLIRENEKYPQNHSKAKASRMETIENYICFVQLGADTSIIAGKGEDGIISYCQEENERAIDILEKTILQ